MHVDIKELHDELQDTKSRLKEVVRTAKSLESASRNEARKQLAEVRDYVLQEQIQHQEAHVNSKVEDDSQSVASQSMRAEGLMQRLEESTERGGINRESRTEVLVKRMAEVSMRRDKRVVLFLCCEDRKRASV